MNYGTVVYAIARVIVQYLFLLIFRRSNYGKVLHQDAGVNLYRILYVFIVDQP